MKAFKRVEQGSNIWTVKYQNSYSFTEFWLPMAWKHYKLVKNITHCVQTITVTPSSRTHPHSWNSTSTLSLTSSCNTLRSSEKFVNYLHNVEKTKTQETILTYTQHNSVLQNTWESLNFTLPTTSHRKSFPLQNAHSLMIVIPPNISTYSFTHPETQVPVDHIAILSSSVVFFAVSCSKPQKLK